MPDFLTTLREFLESDELDEEDRFYLQCIRTETVLEKIYIEVSGHPASKYGLKFQKTICSPFIEGDTKYYLETYNDKYYMVLEISGPRVFSHILIDDLEVTYNNDLIIIEKFKNKQLKWKK